MADAVPLLTLDGPGGVGKGTICLRVARETGWHILDSGSLYRLVGLVAARRGLDLEALPDAQIVSQLAEIAGNLDIDYVARGEQQARRSAS